MKIRRSLLMLGSIGIVNANGADWDDPLTEELPIVPSANRLKQPTREAPLPVMVIDREIIESFPAKSIAELMRLVPGYIEGLINNRATMVTNHGLGGEQARNFQVLIDGRSIYSGILGGVDWENLEINLEDIERIEAVRVPKCGQFWCKRVSGCCQHCHPPHFADHGQMNKWHRGWTGSKKAPIRQSWRY